MIALPDYVAVDGPRSCAGSTGLNGTHAGALPPTRPREARRPYCRIFPYLSGCSPVFTGNGR